MARLFFAKMNINDEIYEVYEGKQSLDNLLKKIYVDISNSVDIYDEKGGRYKFFDLDKKEDNSKITGRIAYIRKGVHSSYDPDTDKAVDREDKNKLEYSTFYLDTFNEMVAFTVTPTLTKKKVLETMSMLIKKCSDVGTVFMLEVNINKLESELSKMDVLKKLEMNLVPPNGDKKEFADLFSINSDRIMESEATQIRQVYSNRKKKGINKESRLVKDAIRGIGLGYAESIFRGKDEHGEKLEIKTEENAPYAKELPSDQNKDKRVIEEKGRAGIVDLMKYKAQIREKKKDDGI